jgi:hypothetical protein
MSEPASYATGQSRRSQKTEAPCVGYAAVARAVGPFDDERTAVMAGFRTRGGSPDTWHTRSTREAMLAAIVAAEDATELAHPGRHAARMAMQRVRRRLELELSR